MELFTSRKFLFAISVLFIISNLFACTPGSTRCVDDNTIYEVCVNGQWIQTVCGSNEVCVLGYGCMNQNQCYPANPNTGMPGNIGDQYCGYDPINPGVFYQCMSYSGGLISWTQMNCPSPQYCQTQTPTVVSCQVPIQNQCLPYNPNTNAPGNAGDSYCPSDTYIAVCGSNGQWQSSECSFSKVCVELSQTSASCQDPEPTTCPQVSYLPSYAQGPYYPGVKYCSPTNSYNYYECSQSGQWQSLTCPSSQVCEQSGTTITCEDSTPPQTTCPQVSYLPSYAQGPYYPGVKYCSPTNSYNYYECSSSGQWQSLTCPSSQVCEQSGTMISCQQNSTSFVGETVCPQASFLPSYAVSPFYIGSQYCSKSSNNVYYQCSNEGVWMHNSCPSNYICKQSAKRVYCNPPSTQSSKINSGQLNVYTSDYYSKISSSCNSWSDWTEYSVSKYSDTIDGVAVECTNRSMRKWCVSASGKYDYSKYQSGESIDCSRSQEQCDFVFYKSESYNEKSDNQMCRDCKRDIYVQQCLPSKKLNLDITEQTQTCNSWSYCFLDNNSTKSHTSNSDSDSFDVNFKSFCEGLVAAISNNAFVFWVILAFVVVCVILLGKKLFSYDSS